MDKYTLRQNIADYTCKHFFDGRASLKGKIIKDLAVLDSDTLMDYYVTLKNQEDYKIGRASCRARVYVLV